MSALLVFGVIIAGWLLGLLRLAGAPGGPLATATWLMGAEAAFIKAATETLSVTAGLAGC